MASAASTVRASARRSWSRSSPEAWRRRDSSGSSSGTRLAGWRSSRRAISMRGCTGRAVNGWPWESLTRCGWMPSRSPSSQVDMPGVAQPLTQGGTGHGGPPGIHPSRCGLPRGEREHRVLARAGAGQPQAALAKPAVAAPGYADVGTVLAVIAVHPGQVQADPPRGAADRPAQGVGSGRVPRVAGVSEVGVAVGGTAVAPVGQVRGEQGPGAGGNADGFCWRRWVLVLTGRGLVPARELNPHGRGLSAAGVRRERAGTVEYFFRLAQRVFRRAEQPAGDRRVGAGGRHHGVIEDQEQH